MSEKTTFTYHYTPSQFCDLLDEFQNAVDCKRYSEKISYDTWRKLKKLRHPKIEYTSPFVKIYDVVKNIDGIDRDTIIYSTKIYNWGFGRFFYDEVFKKEWNKDMTLNSANSATFSCDNTDINRSVLDQLAATSVATKADTAYATALETKADYMMYYDNDSTTGCPNYGTTTDHTTRISGTPLTTNTVELTGIPSLDHFGYHDINGTWDSVASKRDVDDRIEELRRELEKKVDKAEMNVKKENDNMKGFNFDFGPCGNTVRLSMYGMAIQNVAGEWVSYNPDSGEIINVDVFNMADGGKYMYKMPVAISDVAVGDVVIHNRVPMFVTAVGDNGTFTVTDVRAGESKNIIPTRNMFGFNFMTKVVSLFNAFSNAPTADQPFGNMLPFLMMGEGKDIDPMMMFMMMNQGGNNGVMNSMMLYFMTKDNKDGKDFDPMMLFAMSGLMNQSAAFNGGKHAEKPAVQA